MMNLGSIYTGFEGRIGRAQFWVATILVIAIILAILFISLWIVGESDLTVIRLNRFIITLVFLYPLLAVWVKRLHDRGRPGYMVVAFLVPWLLHQATNLLGLTGDPLSLTSIDVLFLAVNIVIGIWFVIDLGLVRGTKGTNKYGPDPLIAGSSPGDVT
jgi:uncharacterized membrane protein YhaH (DUF805 family)